MKPVTPFDNYPSFGNAGSRQAPGDAKYALGFVAADTFPAEWANYFFHGATKGVSDLNTAVRSIWVELGNILDAYGITADISEESQLLTAIGKIYPKITTCATGANTQNKSLAISGNVLKAGDVYVITMTYGNTYGDGTLTYPTMSINSGTAYPICDASGNYLGAGAWDDGETIKVLFTGSRYLMATPAPVNKIGNGVPKAVTGNAVSCVFASSTTVSGPDLEAGGNVKVMFTADISGADETTALSLNYNGTSYPVKACKAGSLARVYAHNIASGVYKYIQAYTTLEFVFDGTNLVIVGNPIVLSSDDYTVYADGKVGVEAVGTIMAISTVEIPYGWLECNGQAVSRSKYASLFQKYNTQLYDSDVTHTLLSRYGIGDGTTTFNLPNYCELVLVGVGQNGSDTIATHDVYAVGEFKDDIVGPHKHEVEGVYYGANSGSGWRWSTRPPAGTNYDDGSTLTTGNPISGATVTHGKQKGVKYMVKVL